MITIEAGVTCAPEKQNNFTVIRMKTAKVRVDRIRLDGRSYKARLTNPEEDAPYDISQWAPHPVWVHFTKSRNPDAKIPVLRKGQVLEV